MQIVLNVYQIQQQKLLMSGRGEKAQEMFITLKAMFPQIDMSIINQQLSFSENLQNLIVQLGTPCFSQTRNEISNMKEAVDKQQLKIQKSLVNEEDVLGNITNRTMRRQRMEKAEKQSILMDPIEQEQSQNWHNQQNDFRTVIKTSEGRARDNMSDIIEDIWELGPEPHKDWFHH